MFGLTRKLFRSRTIYLAFISFILCACGGGGGGGGSSDAEGGEATVISCDDGYLDAQGDCVRCLDNDLDGYGYGADCVEPVDCNDEDSLIHPLALETDDGLDQDCDGDALELKRFDQDGDGFTGEFGGDCNDFLAAVNPYAVEVAYNGLDEDCDGFDLCDVDGDGFLPLTVSDLFACPVSESTEADCNDNDPQVNPDRAEINYNGIDDDCDSTTADADADGDLFLATFAGGSDCNDSDAAINPGRPEVGGNTVDEDCSGQANDRDGDGYDSVLNGGADCDDTSAAINPGASEVAGNEIDEDCSGAANDRDGDGYDSVLNGGADCNDASAAISPIAAEIYYNGINDDCNNATVDNDADGDGSISDAATGGSPDCNDNDANVRPGAAEIAYDGIDQNCDNADLWDVDGDGYTKTGAPDGSADDCDDADSAVNVGQSEINYNEKNDDCNPLTVDGDADGDGYLANFAGGADCNDSNAAINPGTGEIAGNEIDEDCSGVANDRDGDGYESVLNGGADCNDASAAISPIAAEIYYNGINDDCNNATVDNDADGDGSISDAAIGGSPDCNDNDANVRPGAAEIAYDGIDQNCDNADLWDVDGDGYTITGASAGTANDCNDSNSAIHPGAVEVFYNGVDDDCSSATADGDQDGDLFAATFAGGSDCDDTADQINPAAAEVHYDNVDNDCNGATPDNDADGDGWTAAAALGGSPDCNDGNANINPGKTEVAYNGVDENCDGTDLWDVDGDGYTKTGAPFGTADDCNDSEAQVNPGAEEIFYNNIDDDCSAATGDDDADDDGYLAALSGGSDCDDSDGSIYPGSATYESFAVCGFDGDGDGYVDQADGGHDCDDTAAAINPGATEIGDNDIDEDCDGYASDADGDGFLSYAEGGLDCDDTDETISPAESEVYYNGVNEDCSSLTIDNDADGDGWTALAASGGSPDCDDGNPNRNPGKTEVPYNGIDENCDDYDLCDADSDGYYPASMLGKPLCPTGAPAEADCNDSDYLINPVASEIYYNGVNDDCNNATRDGDADGDMFDANFVGGLDCDDGDSEVYPGSATYEIYPVCGYDGDGDGYVTVNDGGNDCNDADAAINPGVADLGGNEIDEDCSGRANDIDGDDFDAVADGGSDCNDHDAAINPLADEVYYNGINDDCSSETPDNDADGDGWTADTATGGTPDCDDTNAGINPSADEKDNGIDEDCDGDYLELTLFDGDGDGFTHYYGKESDPRPDCDDNDAYINPNAAEIFYNSKNDDCNGTTIDNDQDGDGVVADSSTGGAPDCDDTNENVFPGSAENDSDSQCMKDSDADGYGDDSPGGTITAGTDCDDNNFNINIDGVETDDGIDEDCDTDSLELSLFDSDEDGYTADFGRTADPVPDCDDSDYFNHPGVPEEPSNGLDEDCDGEDLVPSDGVGIFVAIPANGGSDINNGTMAHPKATLSSALNLAGTNGKSVFVSGGLYEETAVVNNLSAESKISLYGGYNHSTWSRDINANETTIQAGIFKGNAANLPNTKIAFDGFSLLGNNAYLAGVVAEQSNLFTRNVKMIYSSTGVSMNGFRIKGALDVRTILENSTFDLASSCTGCKNRGVIAETASNIVVKNTVFTLHAFSGGYSFELDDVNELFVYNSEVNLVTRGSFIKFTGPAPDLVEVKYSYFKAQVAQDSTHLYALVNCVNAHFTNNYFYTNWGGLLDQGDGVFTNNTFIVVDPYLDVPMMKFSDAPTYLYNNILYMGTNEACISSSSDNNVFFFNNDLFNCSVVYQSQSLSYLTIADVNVGSIGSGNVASDPLFVDYASGDYHLQAGSPAIDSGMDLYSEGVTDDFDGNPRPIDGDGSATAEWDIGAYEYIP